MELTIEQIEEVMSYVLDEGRRLDLRNVRFVDPYGLLLLDLVLRDREGRGAPLDVVWPTHPPVRSWMRAMALFSPRQGRHPRQP